LTLAGEQDYTEPELMAARRIQIELTQELWETLERIAESFGMADPARAAAIGLTDWIVRRKAELDDHDPAERYFINEALDELVKRSKR
jgi:hypothetical protein